MSDDKSLPDPPALDKTTEPKVHTTGIVGALTAGVLTMWDWYWESSFEACKAMKPEAFCANWELPDPVVPGATVLVMWFLGPLIRWWHSWEAPVIGRQGRNDAMLAQEQDLMKEGMKEMLEEIRRLKESRP